MLLLCLPRVGDREESFPLRRWVTYKRHSGPFRLHVFISASHNHTNADAVRTRVHTSTHATHLDVCINMHTYAAHPDITQTYTEHAELQPV